jgi:hypothetical protein
VIADVPSAAFVDGADRQAWAEVAQNQADSDAPVAFARAAPADPDLDDAASPAWTAAAVDSADLVALAADRVYQAGMADMAADCRRADFPAGCNPADCPVHTADDCSRGGCMEDEADDNFAGDNANRRDSPDG